MIPEKALKDFQKIDKQYLGTEVKLEEVEKVKEEFRYLAEIIFEKWLDERKNLKNLS